MSKLLSLENIAYYDEILKEHIRRSNVSQSVATYDDLPKENLFDGMTVFVVNASGDDTVASGWAVYRYSLSDNSWLKISEQESLDLALDCNDIENKPNLSFGNHSHGNIDSEGKIGNTANLPLITGANGAITTGTFGNTANSFCEGNDSRLSDAREPINHASSKITSMENYEKAEEASSIATTDTLNDAIGKIEFKIDDFQPMDYEDIDVLFSNGQQQKEQISPNTVRFVGVDPQTETVTITWLMITVAR